MRFRITTVMSAHILTNAFLAPRVHAQTANNIQMLPPTQPNAGIVREGGNQMSLSQWCSFSWAQRKSLTQARETI